MITQLTSKGLSLRATAARFHVCEKTVRRWLARARSNGFPSRLPDLSSTPLRQPRKTASPLKSPILDLRRQRRSYAQILTVLPVSKATLCQHPPVLPCGQKAEPFGYLAPLGSRILRRHGLNRLSSLELPKPPVIRYERDAPGDLLHLDIKKLGRFEKPGVRATGDRAPRSPGSGVESLHVAIDDHSRLAFASLFPDEKTPSVLSALQQALVSLTRVTAHEEATGRPLNRTIVRPR